MSPFSTESRSARDATIARWRQVIDGSDAEVPGHLAETLPETLWLYHMGLILFWVHDGSADQMATRLAIARTVPVISRAIGLADVPELRGLVDDLTALLADVPELRGLVDDRTALLADVRTLLG